MKKKLLFVLPLLLIVGCSKLIDNETSVLKSEPDIGTKVEKEINYKDGKLEGRMISYFENGKVEKEEQYKDGKEDGQWTYYFENGQIEKEEN